MTRYVAIAFGRNPPMPSPEDWRPWVESKAADAIFIPLVLNHALRMRGGVHPGDQPLHATVFETCPIGTRPHFQRHIHVANGGLFPGRPGLALR